jgi:hypothetical protein
MSKQDRQKLSILVILLGVLVLTLILGYGMNKPVVTAAVQSAEPKPPSNPSSNPPAPTDARIRLDLIEKSQNSSEEIGRKNVFQYRQTPAATALAGPGSRSPVIPPQPAAPAANEQLPVRPPAVIAPPGPPPIPFKYHGYATLDAPGGQMTAFLTDETLHHYNVAVGEVLMGRYRLTQITANSVEIEDTSNSRRQLVPVTK